jgi:hypothetical protein
MRNKKAIFAGALMVPALALTGGAAYATTTGGPATPAQPAVTATVQPTSHHPAGQIHYRCDWRYSDHRCDWRGHRNQRQATQHQATQHPAYQHHGNRNHHGYQGNGGYQGNWVGYQGSGQYGNGSQWGNGNGFCGNGW